MEVPSIFVNREEELRQIQEAVADLQDETRLLKTPLIEFSGVQGIGKSTLLQNIKLLCEDKKIKCFLEDAADISPQVFNQAKTFAREEEPVVMIVDALDAVDSQQFQDIELWLSDLLESEKTFVVIASRNVQKFERTHSLRRKLTICPLGPLQQEYCIEYLDHFTQTLSPQSREAIFDWTRGYPLAMIAMTRAVQQNGLNPLLKKDQKKLIRILMKEVVDDKLLIHAAEQRPRLRALLSVLSLPRRFHLTLAQDLIVKFASQYALESSLAYITLPQTINEVTNVLSYSLERAGYSIDTPVRNLFLLYNKIEKPEQYVAIHRFLAEKNKEFMDKVSGSDYIRYLREFLYHCACTETTATVNQELKRQIARLVQDEEGTHENFVQFYEEFRQDQELKEALGAENTNFVLALISRTIIEMYRQLPQKDRQGWLKSSFSSMTYQTQNEDFILILAEEMRQLIQRVGKDEAEKLYHELFQDNSLRILLGEQFEDVRAGIFASFLDKE